MRLIGLHTLNVRPRDLWLTLRLFARRIRAVLRSFPLELPLRRPRTSSVRIQTLEGHERMRVML